MVGRTVLQPGGHRTGAGRFAADRGVAVGLATPWQALALGSATKPASYRQKRDGADEFVEGQAQRIDYDSKAGTLRFEGAAVVRRLRGAMQADEIQGAVILWDSTAESFNVQGGAKTETNPGGRVRAVITPRTPDDAASAAGGADTLKPSSSLGDRR